MRQFSSLLVVIFMLSVAPAVGQTAADDATAAARELIVTMKGADTFKAALPSIIRALKPAIVDAGEATKRSPWQIQTELDAVDAGDMQRVKNDVEAWYQLYPITIASKLDRPGTAGGGSLLGGVSPRAVATGATTVNLHLPAGWRGNPLTEAHQQRRRAGRYYARIG